MSPDPTEVDDLSEDEEIEQYAIDPNSTKNPKVVQSVGDDFDDLGGEGA
jgi:hypothetical protein